MVISLFLVSLLSLSGFVSSAAAKLMSNDSCGLSRTVVNQTSFTYGGNEIVITTTSSCPSLDTTRASASQLETRQTLDLCGPTVANECDFFECFDIGFSNFLSDCVTLKNALDNSEFGDLTLEVPPFRSVTVAQGECEFQFLSETNATTTLCLSTLATWGTTLVEVCSEGNGQSVIVVGECTPVPPSESGATPWSVNLIIGAVNS
ncbi:hypothetical protein BT96DRAFT_918863 [Gymnopus androsaceus JB14]|uniref:Uncharacterized protein n=1 Tax=Gymnopus androsaceus JB14 TaxID=1447944 RepID=A0A6A4HTY3_9AGAR|nr:hypothetical protein BT96DRAFT_918863 [Gymnopus androsaceus JB14]